LYINDNQFTSSSLNDLFEKLHDNDMGKQKYINIDDNPGTEDCNRIVAENKGWVIWEL